MSIDTNQGQRVNTFPGSQLNTGGYTPDETANFVRAANATAYTANRVITPANGAAEPLKKASKNGGYIVYVKLSTTDTTLTGDFKVHFMKSAPTTYTDNGAFTLTDDELATSYIATVELTLGTIGTKPGAYDDSLRIPYGTTAGNLYWVLETVTGGTPTSGSTWYIEVMTESNVPNAYPVNVQVSA